MKISNAFAEMMVHVPLCTHIGSKKVSIIGSINDDLKRNFKTLKRVKF